MSESIRTKIANDLQGALQEILAKHGDSVADHGMVTKLICAYEVIGSDGKPYFAITCSPTVGLWDIFGLLEAARLEARDTWREDSEDAPSVD